MASPFERAFDKFARLQEEASKFTSESAPEGVREGDEVMAIHYREEEAIYIKASHDRVTVIFSTIFREETDRIFGKVFLQEFVDARRRAIQNAPQVLIRNDPPLELQNVSGLPTSGTGEVGYVTFGTNSQYCIPKSSPLTRSSAFPSTSYTPATTGDHIPYSDFPRLLPLPYQSIQGRTQFLVQVISKDLLTWTLVPGLYSFEDEATYSRLPPRYDVAHHYAYFVTDMSQY